MFAKGANYIPQDALLTNVTTERYHTLFRDIKEANMNVIRVWGGEPTKTTVSMTWQMKTEY